MKKLVLVFCLIFLLAIVSGSKIDVSTTKEIFSVGEEISFKISLLDSSNKLINENVDVIIENPDKVKIVEKSFLSNDLVEVSLGENPQYGYWKITAEYEEEKASELFMIEIKEIADFKLQNDILTITNMGNTKYVNTIQIIIGDTLGTKKVDLDVGEKMSFRLIAPDGNYDVRVSDGKTTLTKNNVQLTGNVVGVLDESLKDKNPLTGGLSPGENLSIFGNSTFVYVFLIVIFAVGLLLVIERHFRKKYSSENKKG